MRSASELDTLGTRISDLGVYFRHTVVVLPEVVPLYRAGARLGGSRALGVHPWTCAARWWGHTVTHTNLFKLSNLTTGSGALRPRPQTAEVEVRDATAREPDHARRSGRRCGLWPPEHAILRCGRLLATVLTGQRVSRCHDGFAPSNSQPVRFHLGPKSSPEMVWIVCIRKPPRRSAGDDTRA